MSGCWDDRLIYDISREDIPADRASPRERGGRDSNPLHKPLSWLTRLPFFYGWVVVAVSFVTLAFGVNARTAFSLLFPPLLADFGWERGTTAAAFSIGFLATTLYAPFSGMLMDRFGPRLVLSMGVVLVCLGMAGAPFITAPWHLYLTLGILVVGGSFFVTYFGHSLFLPNWFVRRRGLAVGIAFSGGGCLALADLARWSAYASPGRSVSDLPARA